MSAATNQRPPCDKVSVDPARYAHDCKPAGQLAFETARLTLIDSLACAFEALAYPDCTRLLGPIVPGTIVPIGDTPARIHAVLAGRGCEMGQTGQVGWDQGGVMRHRKRGRSVCRRVEVTG